MQYKKLKPFIKWPGGKYKELVFITPNLPENIDNYYEPFVGGGAVFFSLSKANQLFINDKSRELIRLYSNLRDNNTQTINALKNINEYWKYLDKLYFLIGEKLEDIFILFKNNHNQQNKEINTFINNNISLFINNLEDFPYNFDLYKKELYKNISRKMQRMTNLEKEKGLLSYDDIKSNLTTAIKSAFYMYARDLLNNNEIYNIESIKKSCIYFFIRNYSYSSMFRYNSKGQFNVPYGGIGYNNNYLDNKINHMSSNDFLYKLYNTTIENDDFYTFLKDKNITSQDFIFLDPPYDTEFSTYERNEFTRTDQDRLSKYLINETKAKWMLVIKNTDFIYKLYNKENIHIRSFDKSYSVSFMDRNNKKAEHLLITNY